MSDESPMDKAKSLLAFGCWKQVRMESEGPELKAYLEVTNLKNPDAIRKAIEQVTKEELREKNKDAPADSAFVDYARKGTNGELSIHFYNVDDSDVLLSMQRRFMDEQTKLLKENMTFCPGAANQTKSGKGIS